METLKRRHLKLVNGRRKYFYKTYEIFTKSEADGEGLSYKPWRECEEGEWGLSDDGYIAVCLKRKSYTKGGRESINIVYPFGQCFINTRSRLEYLSHRNTGEYSRVSSKPHWEANKGRTQYKNFVKAYVKMFLVGEIDYTRLGKIFSKKEPKPFVKAKALLKKAYIKEMIDKELEKEFKERKMSKGTVLDMFKEAYDIAKVKNDAGNMLRTAENLSDMLNMKQKEQKMESFEAEFVALEGIEEQMGITSGNGELKKLAESAE